MLNPAIGQRVLYWPRQNELLEKHGQPFMAFIVHVHSRHMVNLFVISDRGIPQTRVHVQYLTPKDAEAGDCCPAPYDMDKPMPFDYPPEPFA